MKYTLEKRREKWLAEMERWERKTENYRDYGLKKSFQLDHKYRMDRPGLAGIRKVRSRRFRPSAASLKAK